MKDKDKGAAGYVSSSLMVCTAPILFTKIIMTEKIGVMFLFVCNIKVIRMLSLNVVHCQVQKRK